MRCLRLTAAIVVAVGVLGQAPSVRAEPSIEAVARGVNPLLSDYGRAFRTHDAALLRTTMRGGAFADRELRSLADSSTLPFAAYDLHATSQFSGNLASPRVQRMYPGLDVRTYHVIVRTRFDIEDGPYIEDGAYTFVRKAPDAKDLYDGWRLASTSDLDVLAFFSADLLWDEGPVTAQRSPHFLLLTHPQIAKEMKPVLAVAERSYAKATGFWPRKNPNDRYLLIIPTSTDELGRMLHTTVDLSKFVAFTASAADPVTLDEAHPRIFVQVAHLRHYGADQQLQILAHELVHAVTRPLSGPHIPSWVEEGIANTGGGNGGRPMIRGGPIPADFPSDDEFSVGSILDIQRHYDEGQIAVQALIASKGIEGFARFYETLGAARIVPGNDRYQLGRALQSSVGWTIDDWLAAWHKALR